jgi:hypothetical protein
MDIYVPLKTVVSFALDQHAKSIKDFDKWWILAFRALVQLNQSVSAEPKTVRLPVESNKTVVLPDDYVSMTKVGLITNYGDVFMLRKNNSLSAFRSNNSDRLSLNSGNIQASNTLSDSPMFFNYYDGGLYYNIAAAGRIPNSDYRLDEKNGVIILSPEFPYSDVVLEYISNPQRDEDYQVHQCLQEAIIAFIEWKQGLGTDQAFYARVIEGRRALPNKRFTLQSVIDGSYLTANAVTWAEATSSSSSASSSSSTPSVGSGSDSGSSVDLSGYATLNTLTVLVTETMAALSSHLGKLILIDASGGDLTYTINPSTFAGYVIRIKRIDSSSNAATIAQSSGNMELNNGQDQSSVTLQPREEINLYSYSSKLIQL